ncbi:MAG: crotonobetainyl-CoA--carnitine CoA-transferase [Myxococcales bacterium]|nr:crotonobetainyl-CoA--carnitine CoA-transferase [Myxococcales bacterium]
MDELYRRIVNVPGVIVEFGVWWGANLALFESLRAVYEPYNFTRSIIGFDTFEGHTSTSPQDGTVAAEAAERYRLRNDYPDYLGEVLKYHRRENPMGHLTRQEVIKGDAGDGLERYLEEHPETIVALAYFDMQLYEPTKRCLELIRPRMTRGSVIAMDELNSSEFPGETIAFAETIGLDGLRLRRSRYLPDRTYGTVE